ncbi:MAG TPA: NAD(P)/FAD-dependent oxidoreductase [Solirubrobacteraceae bacterium]|jgi:2-polyprenyl-6-methoxyphenol hydroxylase-like FAD-dependent oxidoreductase|nr:NAD(P)/FAD-dependent oxidoreductase [Solirubrobacteraceae bacterium]
MVDQQSGNGNTSDHGNGSVGAAADFDAIVVGASLAGCATAIMLARAGARVALVEQRPEMSAYKKVCSHYIQSSAVATLERLELLEPMTQAGAVRSRVRLHGPAGWVEPTDGPLAYGVNLRREVLDPLIRAAAAETPGVELMLGETVGALLREGETVCGVTARDRSGHELRLRAKLVVAADGRGSRVAKLAGVRERKRRNERFAYGAYFEGPTLSGGSDALFWLLDPDMAAAFPTDSGLTFYAAMPTKRRLARFREDPAGALVELVSSVPDAPPIRASRIVSQPEGKLDMTNVAHAPTAPGLALVGDAALAEDPLWGIGCGWALQSAEWLADSVGEALAHASGDAQARPIARGLARYRRKHRRMLGAHAFLMNDFATGRKMSPIERLLFDTATYDRGVARVMEAFGTRNISPARMFVTAIPRAAAARVRRPPARDAGYAPPSVALSGAGGEVSRGER